jgi:hypothetical protein
MTVEFSALHKILKDPTRRNILRCLKDNGTLPYVELMVRAEVTNTGRFNYHLKALGSLIEKQGDGRYVLTERGRLAVQLLDEFPEKPYQPREQKPKNKKLVATAVILLASIVAISAFLVIMQSPQASFNVTYWKQQTDQSFNSYNGTYLFNATGTHETFQLAPSGEINQALATYVSKYPFVIITDTGGIEHPLWTCEYIHDGNFVFTLFFQSALPDAQLKSLTQDLTQALKNTQ